MLAGKQPGDLVTGTLVVGEVEAYLSKLSGTGHRALAAATPLPADGSAILQPGDPVADAVLVDQDGQTRRFSAGAVTGWRSRSSIRGARCPSSVR